MKRLNGGAWWLSLWLAAVPITAMAQSPEPAAEAGPGTGVRGRVFHWPIGEAQPGRRGLVFSARVDGPMGGWTLRLRWRPVDQQAWRTEVFTPARDGLFEARLARDQVTGDFLYFLEVVSPDGVAEPCFASEALPQRVTVTGGRGDAVDQALKAFHGRRHRVEATFRRVDFGHESPGDPRSTDRFNQLTLGYTFRLLHPALYQVSIGVDLVGDRLGVRMPSRLELEDRPGAYLGFVKLAWHWNDIFGLEPVLMWGASQRGMEAGGGLMLRFGALHGTHFDLGFSGVRTLGWRFEAGLDVLAASFLRLGFHADITNWPFNEDYGVVPGVRVAFLLPFGLELNGEVTYGLRRQYDRGWIGGSAGLAFEF